MPSTHSNGRRRGKRPGHGGDKAKKRPHIGYTRKNSTDLIQEELQLQIVDYLEFHKFRATVDAFKREKKRNANRRKAPLPKSETKGPTGTKLLTELQRLYDEGEGVELFKVLKAKLSNRTKKQYNSLWFYLQVYFAIHPLLFTQTTANNISSKNVKVKKSMARFRKYLERSGVAKNSTFLPYYALPFVSDPVNHPSFSKLFTAEWVSDLRDQFCNFLLIEVKDETGPRLTKMYKAWKTTSAAQAAANGGSTGGGGGEDSSTQERQNIVNATLYLEAKSQEQVMRSNLEGMQATMEEMLKCSVQLFEQLNLVNRGKAREANINDRYLAAIRQRLTVFSENVHSIRAGQALVPEHEVQQLTQQHQPPQQQQQQQRQDHGRSLTYQTRGDGVEADAHEGHVNRIIRETVTPVIERKQARTTAVTSASAAATVNANHNNNNTNTTTTVNGKMVVYQHPTGGKYSIVIAPLDYDKVTASLLMLNGVQKALLIQALRWRLNRPALLRQRRETLMQYINADFLQLNAARDPGVMFQQLILSKNELVRETTVRLINSMVSHASGRSYFLRKHSNVVLSLFEVLQMEGHSDTPARQQALGALQKISLRRAPQTVMINAGLMEWVTQHVLLPDDSMSEYSREYGTALLMNLSLRTNGKMRCEANSLNVLASLCNLLESENGQVRTYVNGTLYSLLSRSALIHAAKEMGMEGILTEIRDQAQETFQRQIDCILQQLRSEGDEGDEGEYSDDEDEVADQDDENEEEEEEDDEEVEEDELLSLEHSGLRGEELLCSSYLADGENASSQVQAASQSIAVRADERAIHPGPNNHYDIDSEMSLPQRPITPGQGLGRTSTSNSGYNDNNNMSTSNSTGEQKQAQEQKGEEFIAPANINTDPEQEDGFKSHKQLLRSPQGQSRQTFFPTAENQEEQEERQYSQQQFQDNLPQHLQGQLEGFEGFSAEDAKEEAVDLVPPLGQTKHSASKRKIPPPKVGNEDDADGNHNDEAYYNAFRSRSNVGRTPVSSAFAESGEFG